MSRKIKKVFIASLIFSQIFLAHQEEALADSIILNKETTQGVNVRAKEDINSEILGGIEDFSIYEIKSETDDWYEIEFEGKKGYVGKNWFYRLDDTTIISPSDLKADPDEDSENLTKTKLQAQSKVTILDFDEESGYVKISYDQAYKNNKAINDIDIEEIENSSLLFDLADDADSTPIKTVTLKEADTDVDLPSVVTLSDRPQTVAMDEDFEESLNYDGPIEGYVDLASLAISTKDEEEIEEIKDFYQTMNEEIANKLKAEEALLNQVREIQTVNYITTTSYQTTYQEPVTEEQNPNTIMVPVSGSEVGVELYKWATQFVGRPYVLGGTSLTHGIDCSGFTMRIYQQIGIGLPHFAQSQQRYGIEIPFGQEQAGDLVFYGTGFNNITHVGMADGHGNMIHASSPRVGIIISPIRNPYSIKRIVQ